MKPVVRVGLTWMWFTLAFVLAKGMFMLGCREIFSSTTPRDWLDVAWHGLRLDMGVAGYLTALPALTSIAAVWLPGRWSKVLLKVYFAIVSLLCGLLIVLNTGLYPYWRFPLDMTPVFYFTTSPSSALASLTFPQWILALLGTALTAAVIYAVCALIWRGAFSGPLHRKGLLTAILTIETAALFIPIRGGFTVATLNPGTAFFSERPELNHAALNPVFSLLYSATHYTRLDRLGHYMEPGVAERLFGEMRAKTTAPTDSTAIAPPVLSTTRPDIYIILLESFSASVIPSLGGEDIAVGLDSIAATGWSWSNFFATGSRTDRGIPSVVGALPSPPVSSVMKFTSLASQLPALPSLLRAQGYDTRYYYGGDANFTNMRSYLTGAGFNSIVSEDDFPRRLRTGKWGVADGPLFEKANADITSGHAAHSPHLTVIQTSSSHEPFEVPATFARHVGKHPAVNAFAYTDSVVASFVRHLSSRPEWGRTLVLLVADHWGAYPHDLADPRARHHIPFIVTGGALLSPPAKLDTYGVQPDIAPTLLSWMEMDAAALPFGRSLTDPAVPHFAVWMDADRAGVHTSQGEAYINTDTGATVAATGQPGLDDHLRAYVQYLYAFLAAHQ